MGSHAVSEVRFVSLCLILMHLCRDVCTGHILSAEEDSTPTIQCFDCNYSPSGDVRSSGGWINSELAGFSQCALLTNHQRRAVDKVTCSAAMCFLRLDPDGLLYRGCADADRLPWTTATDVSCQPQGQTKALWWFCNSTLCNDGGLFERGRCEPSAAVGPPRTTRRVDVVHGFATAAPTTKTPAKKLPMAKEGMDTVDEVVPSNHGEVIGSLCDGRCRDNPSGLFQHPDGRTDRFVHCGHGTRSGRACFCCHPFEVDCPPGTSFNDARKVCANRLHAASTARGN